MSDACTMDPGAGSPTAGPVARATGHLLRKRPARRALARLPARILARLWAWRERARSRRLLLSLHERALRDIGLAADEAHQPFWR